MSDTETLSETVASIESKAERKRQAEDVESDVDRAHEALGRINHNLDDLADAVAALQFYRELLLDAFDGEEPVKVGPALDRAEAVIQKDQDAMVRTLRDGEGEALRAEIADTIDDVKAARRAVRNRLEDEYWSEWNDRLSSARELQAILDSENLEFNNTLDWLEELLKGEMQNPDQSASSVVKQWERAVEQWEDHQDLQGISKFQDTYGISDDAVDTIRTLSQDSTTLGAVDVTVLEELKQIPELADAISLEI